jgi:N-sulfoglucosamine sulfohydrolase
MLGAMLEALTAANELDNTIIILSGDHGIPGVPRGKTNCYDLATRVPLLVRWPKKIQAGRTVDDFVSVMDIGPTLLELAGVKVPKSMDGVSFYPQLASNKSGWIDHDRNEIIIGRELHYPWARDGNLPYPMRAVRTVDHLYIRNFKPDRWPMGAPYNIDDTIYHDQYKDLINAPWRDMDASLTKSWILKNRHTEEAKKVIKLTIDKRPSEELYELHKDPHQLINLAKQPASKSTLKSLRKIIDDVMKNSKDPRLNDAFDRMPWIDPKKSKF